MAAMGIVVFYGMAKPVRAPQIWTGAPVLKLAANFRRREAYPRAAKLPLAEDPLRVDTGQMGSTLNPSKSLNRPGLSSV